MEWSVDYLFGAQIALTIIGSTVSLQIAVTICPSHRAVWIQRYGLFRSDFLLETAIRAFPNRLLDSLPPITKIS